MVGYPLAPLVGAPPSPSVEELASVTEGGFTATRELGSCGAELRELEDCCGAELRELEDREGPKG